MGPCETCVTIGLDGNPKWMDKWIRKSKGTNEVMTCGMRGHSHLTHLRLLVERGKKGRRKKKRKEKERVVESETLPSL